MSLQPLLSLDNSVTTRFSDTGDVRVTVQAACGNSVLQDSRVLRVLGESFPGSGGTASASLLQSRRPGHVGLISHEFAGHPGWPWGGEGGAG